MIANKSVNGGAVDVVLPNKLDICGWGDSIALAPESLPKRSLVGDVAVELVPNKFGG